MLVDECVCEVNDAAKQHESSFETLMQTDTHTHILDINTALSVQVQVHVPHADMYMFDKTKCKRSSNRNSLWYVIQHQIRSSLSELVYCIRYRLCFGSLYYRMEIELLSKSYFGHTASQKSQIYSLHTQ